MNKSTVLILAAWFAGAPFAAAEPARAPSFEEWTPRPGDRVESVGITGSKLMRLRKISLIPAE